MKATSSGVCSPFVSWPFRATYLVVEVFKWKGRPSDESCVLEQKAERERERGTALNLVVYDSVLSFLGEIRADNNNRGNRDQWRAGLFLLERQGNVQRTLPSGWLSPVWQALRERGSWLLLATTPAFPRPKTNNTQEGKRVLTAAGRYSLQADDKRTTISRRPAVVSWLVLTFRAYRTHVKKGVLWFIPQFWRFSHVIWQSTAS